MLTFSSCFPGVLCADTRPAVRNGRRHESPRTGVRQVVAARFAVGALAVFVQFAAVGTSRGDDVPHPAGRLPVLRKVEPAKDARDAVRPPTALPVAPWLRMPAEFERQELLVLSCGELTPGYESTITDIVQAIRGEVRVAVLYRSDEQLQIVQGALQQRLDSVENIQLLKVPHDTKWVRDYGPTFLQSGQGFRAVDWLYSEDRPNDERLPERLAAMSGTPCEAAAIVLPGGNLLSNGHGLCITTSSILDDNAHLGVGIRDLNKLLVSRIGARQLLVLESLVGEPTGHIDMFLTMTGPNTVVVGQYSTAEDPENAALLDRNAARLERVETPFGRLQVHRVPMGERHQEHWRTYTNCIYANGVLVVPSYQGGDRARLATALSCYRRLLPGWHIVTVDASALIGEGGALHCAALNIPGLAQPLRPLPLQPDVVPLEQFIPAVGVRSGDGIARFRLPR